MPFHTFTLLTAPPAPSFLPSMQATLSQLSFEQQQQRRSSLASGLQASEDTDMCARLRLKVNLDQP